MNPLFARFLSSVCRKEPISGFILVFGATDALLGGMGGRSNLLFMGLFFISIGFYLRFLQRQKANRQRRRNQRFSSYDPLPPAISNQPLPLLVRKKPRRK